MENNVMKLWEKMTFYKSRREADPSLRPQKEPVMLPSSFGQLEL